MYVHHRPCLRRGNIKMSTKLASVHPASLPTSCRKPLRIMGIFLARTAISVWKFQRYDITWYLFKRDIVILRVLTSLSSSVNATVASSFPSLKVGMVRRRREFCKADGRCESIPDDSVSCTWDGVAGGDVIGDVTSPPKSLLACGDIGSKRDFFFP